MAANSVKANIRNVGGIDSDVVELGSGVTILSGQNATNRTSLLKSIMAGLGDDDVAIRSGMDEGSVELTLDGDEYERVVEATEDGYYWKGESVVEEIEMLKLFSFLLEDNEIRQAVANGDDLYDILMRPVDTDEIEREIEQLKRQREEIQKKESKVDEKKNRITKLQNESSKKEEEIQRLQSTLKDVESEISSVDQTHVELSKIDKTKELNEELKQKNQELNNLKDEIKKTKKLISVREEHLSELQSGETENIEDLYDTVSENEAEIETHRERISALEDDKRTVTPLKRFLNQMTGDGVSPERINEVANKYVTAKNTSDRGSKQDTLTDVLVKSDSEAQCVLCGGEIEKGHYDELLREINSVTSEIDAENRDIQSKIEELQSERSDIKSSIREIRSNKDEIETVENQLDSLRADLVRSESRLEDVTDEKESIKNELDDLEQEAIEKAEDTTNQLRALEREKTELEIDIQNAKETVESNQSEITNLKADVHEIENLSAKKEAVNDQLKELRGKVQSIESSIVERFNNQMEEVIDALSYEGIERVWIKKRDVEVREGRRKVQKTVFDLNIVREVDGKVTNDVVSNLSESEREVTGLVLALAGYLVHDVGDVFPIIMMDSVEMIDATRLENLLEYMEEYVEFLIVATLPEDSDVMDVGTVIEKESVEI